MHMIDRTRREARSGRKGSPHRLDRGTALALAFVIVAAIGGAADARADAEGFDSEAPVITATRSVAPNDAGWNRTDVTVSWTCTDNLPGATLDVDSHSFTTESATHSKTVTCTDAAGNTATDTQRVKIDKSAPLTSIDMFVGGDLSGRATDNLSGVASTTVSWTSLGTITTGAVCYSGCKSTNVKWRATPPQPGSNVYRVAARSVDLAGNIGPTYVATLPVFIVMR
jgi:hypothetical protein